MRCGTALSDSVELRLLRRAKTVIATGAALLNDTIDLILSHSIGIVVLVGPTAGCHPQPLLEEGVHFVQSTRLTDIDDIVRALKLGEYVGGRSWGYVRGGNPYSAMLATHIREQSSPCDL